MSAQDAEAAVDLDESAPLALEGGEVGLDQVGEEPLAFWVVGAGGRGLEAVGVPAPGRREVAPGFIDLGATVELVEEAIVAEGLAVLAGVVEELLVGVEGRDGGVGMVGFEPADVGVEDLVFQTRRGEHVHGQLEELLAADPREGVAQLVELAASPGCRVVGQHEVEDGHEVALAGAEGAVEVGGLAAAGGERTVDDG